MNIDMNLDAALSKPIERPAPTATSVPISKRPNILTVQGCSGCGRPRKMKVKTPLGVRRIISRLKMTRMPGVVAVLPPHASSSGMPRRASVHAPLCKSCRAAAQEPVLTAAEIRALDPKPAAA